MPTDPITLVETTDDFGAALIDKVRPTQRRRHWWHVESVSTDHTVDEDSEFLTVDATGSGDVTITVPAAATYPGQCIVVHCEDIASGNSIIVESAASGETVGGAASQSITAVGALIQIVCDGVSDWIVLIDTR